jgi:hypothetical protein
MLGTEIDDIFSGKTGAKVKSKVVTKSGEGKSERPTPQETQITTMRGGEGKKRKTKKKKEGNKDAILSSKKVEEEERASGDENEKEPELPIPLAMKKPKKRPRDDVEEVVDPSIAAKKPRLEKDGKDTKPKGRLVFEDTARRRIHING